MVLTEQKINRIGRQYWRGSEKKSWEESQINFNCFYVTTKPVYAASHAKDENDDYHYLTQYNLKEKINIFNMRYKKDETKIEDLLRVTNRLHWMNTFKYLKDEDWLTVLGIRSREFFIDILKKLGYDGFFNIESVGGTIERKSFVYEPVKDGMDLYGFSGIGLFDKSCLIFNREYCGWDQIKTVEGIEKEREAQFNYIKRFLVNIHKTNQSTDKIELESRFFLLTKKEIKDIVVNFDYEKEKKILEENWYNSRLYKLMNMRRLEKLLKVNLRQ